MLPRTAFWRCRPPRRPRCAWRSSTSPTASTWPTGRRSEEGTDFELSPTLEPLQPFKDDLLVLTGLTLDKARRQRRRPRRPRPRHGRVPDRLPAAQDRRRRHPRRRLGRSGRRPEGRPGHALRLAGDRLRGRPATPATATPATAAPIPRTSPGAANRRRWPRKSIRGWSSSACSARRSARDDDAADQPRSLQARASSTSWPRTPRRCTSTLGADDQRKLDEYLTGVREIEQRHRRGRRRPPRWAKPRWTGRRHPASDYEEHIRSDGRPAGAGVPGRPDARSPRSCSPTTAATAATSDIDVPEGHHDLSHHGGDKAKLEKIQKINHFHIEQFAYLLEQAEGGQGRRRRRCWTTA